MSHILAGSMSWVRQQNGRKPAKGRRVEVVQHVQPCALRTLKLQVDIYVTGDAKQVRLTVTSQFAPRARAAKRAGSK